MEDSQETNIAGPRAPVSIYSPKAWYIEFLLHFLTLGIYSSVWLSKKHREFNTLFNKKYIPWLWFFVPFIFIIQLVALPRFLLNFNHFKTDLKDENHTHNNHLGLFNIAWLLLFLTSTLAINIADRIGETPIWVYVILMILRALLFTLIQFKLEQLQRSCSSYETTHHSSIKVIEWFYIIPTVIICVGIIVLMIRSVSINTIEKLSPGMYYSINKDYALSIIGDSWERVEAGSFTEGDSELELKGPLDDMYFIIFKHDINTSISELARLRIKPYTIDSDTKNCSYNKQFIKNTTTLITEIVCKHTFAIWPEMNTVTFIETQNGIIELYGYLYTEKKFFNKYSSTMLDMARSLRP